jgi:hypothetical protein
MCLFSVYCNILVYIDAKETHTRHFSLMELFASSIRSFYPDIPNVVYG